MRHPQVVQYEPAELLPNVMKAEQNESCVMVGMLHGSRSKIPSKKSRQAALRGGI
jgi:hypothetical protein